MRILLSALGRYHSIPVGSTRGAADVTVLSWYHPRLDSLFCAIRTADSRHLLKLVSLGWKSCYECADRRCEYPRIVPHDVPGDSLFSGSRPLLGSERSDRQKVGCLGWVHFESCKADFVLSRVKRWPLWFRSKLWISGPGSRPL